MSRSGFDSPNHTQTPNGLFELLPDMDETELRVTLVIIRETFGWHRPSAALSLSELKARTGLSRQGVFNGVAKGKARGTIVQTGGVGKTASYSLVVHSVDQSTQLTSTPSGPVPVHSVDQTSPLSRPALVNSVDQLTPSGVAPSAGKSEAERKSKEIQRKERKETETGESVPPAAPASAASAPSRGQSSNSGAADAARAAPPPDPVQGSPQAPPGSQTTNATSTGKVPPAAGAPVEKPVDNFPDTPARRYLVGYFGVAFLTELLDEDPARSDWFQLPTETLQTLKDDAIAAVPGKRWKGELILRLDAEAVKLRRANRPTTPSATIARKVQQADAEIDRILGGAP